MPTITLRSIAFGATLSAIAAVFPSKLSCAASPALAPRTYSSLRQAVPPTIPERRPQGVPRPLQSAPGTVSQTPEGQQYPDDERLKIVRRLLQSGRISEAEMVAQTVVNARPEVDRAKFFLALAIHKQKRYGQARAMLEASMLSSQPFPEHGHVSHFLGWCCYYTGDLEAAKRAFETHAAAWPNFDDTHYGLGVIALDEDRVEDAEASFETALRLQQLNPNDRRSQAKTIARLGDIALRQDKFDVAMSRYESAVELWPDHYEAWARLVRLYNRAGREADASRATEREQQARVRMGRAEPEEGTTEGGDATPSEVAGDQTKTKEPSRDDSKSK